MPWSAGFTADFKKPEVEQGEYSCDMLVGDELYDTKIRNTEFYPETILWQIESAELAQKGITTAVGSVISIGAIYKLLDGEWVRIWRAEE